VYLIDASLFDAFSINRMDLVAYETIPSMETVREFAVTYGGGSLALRYLESGETHSYSADYHWFIREGERLLALDTARVEALVTQITALTLQSCVDYHASDLSIYGLAEPVAVVTVDYDETVTVAGPDGDVLQTNPRKFVLELGGCLADQVYVRLPGSQMVYTVAADVLDELLFASYDSLRPDDVCRMDYATVDSMDFTIKGQTRTLTISRFETVDETGVPITHNTYLLGETSLDSVAVADVLTAITGLEAYGTTQFVGLESEPALTIVFHRSTRYFPTMELSFTRYDSSGYLVTFDGASRLLVDAQTVENLQAAICSLLSLS